MLQGCPHVLERKSTCANNEDSLSPKVQALHLVPIAVTDMTQEGLLVLPVHLPALAYAPVHVESHGTCLHHHFFAILDAVHCHQVAPIRLFVHLGNLRVCVDVPVAVFAGDVVYVPEDVTTWGMILVRPAPSPPSVHNPVADLRGVHTGVVISVIFPHTTNAVVALNDDEGFACLRHLHGLENAADAGPDNHAIHLRRDLFIHWTNVWECTVGDPAVILREGGREPLQQVGLWLETVALACKVGFVLLGCAEILTLEVPVRCIPFPLPD
mmetsp:Transcript_5690/g.13330  ORF Transcript_5690/g.13330 Transcript_5690/m.13330 type:complete len:269 (+) Transcript_5690:1399-2205(+)